MTCLGRTGKMFAFEYDDVIPDIVIVGKGLGSGYPVTAVLSTAELMKASPFSDPSFNSSSFAAFPMACAAVGATLEVTKAEGLPEKAAALGVELLAELKRMEQVVPIMGEARGNTVTDVDGNTFLDVVGAIGVNGLGHSHPKWTKAISDQVQRVSAGSFSSNARVELMEKVAEHAPAPGVHRLQLYSGGAEAVESALRLAKCKTGKTEFVSFWGGFHGKTMGVLSLMGSDFKKGLGPLVPGNHLVPYANCYRCPLKLKYPSCGMACVELAESHAH